MSTWTKTQSSSDNKSDQSSTNKVYLIKWLVIYKYGIAVYSLASRCVDVLLS